MDMENKSIIGSETNFISSSSKSKVITYENFQIDVQNTLIKKFNEIKLKNSKFSLRAFAKKLEITPSAASEIMKGKRTISEKLAKKISTRLKLNPTESSIFFSRFEDNSRKIKKILTTNVQEKSILQDNDYEVVSHWSTFAILSILKLDDFKSDTQWIATRLGIDAEQVEDSLRKLLKLKMINYNEEGKLQRAEKYYSSSDDKTNYFVRNHHISDLNIIKKCIETLSPELRDLSNLTFPANPETLQEIKVILRTMHDEIAMIMGQGTKKEVYKICTYLFPLTKNLA